MHTSVCTIYMFRNIFLCYTMYNIHTQTPQIYYKLDHQQIILSMLSVGVYQWERTFSCLYRLLQVDRKFTDIFYTFTISLLGEYNPLVILIEIYRDLVTHTIPEIKIHKKYQFMIYSLKYIYYFLKYNYLCLSNKLNVNAINICYSKSKVIFFVNFSRYSFFYLII